jgi:Flp pilus assembly protein TadB
MSESKSTHNGGIGLGTLLFLVFLVLKLCGVIAWSWWWVTAPLWIPFLIVLLGAFIIFCDRV